MSKENPILMIIEDEALLLEAITKKLELEGIETVSCTSGEQAIDYMKNLSEHSKVPDGIWLDFRLKSMDGIEVMNHIKEIDAAKNIPVVVVSNSASRDKVDGMLALGAKEYLLKAEHTLDEIIEAFRNFIKEEK